ncbi:hypothetical protein P153DRAFT_12612 [Dothidotthia symphoricarpi CBS 119687]|uniref:Uncharacterized protein n=1 Tax=Dothidotthia symphoricarpi CBS 119687 TaxID=1392245 RepID=A0A6A6ASI8_9PLEO|nr:uncharacterized protein P153DRAFT_12612 [Dothidotthia symphoricarpi CBS 119687]KAF2134919.1 hypothetical protein P153DRAFT_12612 [Dothidotthia symphoricarpi CBS 119687]
MQLQWNAGYGCLPFDLFVLDHWESTTSALPATPQQRWDELARRYLSLPLIKRWPLYKRVLDALSEVGGAAPLPSPTEEQIGRIFAPHQSIQECNLSAKFCSGWNTVWLRTCYSPSLTQKYREIEQTMGARAEVGCLESPDHVLDESSLYGFRGSDQEVLDQLLLRIPCLTDAHGVVDEYGDGSLLLYGSGQNDPGAIKHAEEDEAFEEIRKLGLNVQNFVYVVDDEAVEKNLVKIWWFNEFGKIIWDNVSVAPYSDLSGMLGAIQDGQGFEELVGEESQRGDVIRG